MTNPAAGYKIGKASKLTGISTDKLRIWERRYEAVTPLRSDAGGRLYGYDDIQRLKLIKTLIDSGDSIGNVAILSLEELQSRVAEETQAGLQGMQFSSDEPIRLAIVGKSLSAKFSLADESVSVKEINENIEVVASYDHASSLGNEPKTPKVDIVIYDKPALQEEYIPQILDIMDHLNAHHTLVVYRFASQETLNRLPKSKFTTLRAPVEIDTIKEHCSALFARNIPMIPSDDVVETVDAEVVPARRYDDETLVKIADMSSAVKCECPHHLAELLFSLAAFEKYSSECESLNTEDSELHAFLSNSASKARHMIENALDKVIEVENIQL